MSGGPINVTGPSLAFSNLAEVAGAQTRRSRCYHLSLKGRVSNGVVWAPHICAWASELIRTNSTLLSVHLPGGMARISLLHSLS